MFEKNEIFVRWEIELMDLADLFYSEKKKNYYSDFGNIIFVIVC